MQSPISAPGRSGTTASSSIRALAPGGDVRQNWVSIAQVASAVISVADGLQLLRDQIAVHGDIRRPLIHLHPFKIYQLPGILRPNGGDVTVDWLKVRIRAGRVLETDATGTDGVNDDPDSEYIPLDATDILVPDNTPRFWFWLEIGDNAGATTAVVRYGPEPTAESYGAWTTDNPWDGAPKPDAAHVPIGWVDTATNRSNYNAIIRQYLRTDLVFLGSECP